MLSRTQTCKSLDSFGFEAALTTFTLFSRKSSITAETVDSYKGLLKNARDDLEARLQSIDEKLETIIEQNVTGSGSDTAELRRIKEERLSTQKCLQICAQLSEHIDQIQLTTEHNDSSPERMDPEAVSERLTSDVLQECKNSLALTTAKLERHMEDLVDRLMAKSASTSEDTADLARLREEWDTARQCMNICSKADIHLKENISNIDNYSTGDAVQFMVSTNGKTLHGRNRGLGWRTKQFGGYMSDVTVQKISRDFSGLNLQNRESEILSSEGHTPSMPGDETENNHGSEFQERYGRGFKLTSKTTAKIPLSSTESTEARRSSTGKG